MRFINISCTSSGSHLQWSRSFLHGRRIAQLFRLFLKTLPGRFVVAYSRCDVTRFFLTPGTSNYNGRPAQKLGTVKKIPLNFVLFGSAISNFCWAWKSHFLIENVHYAGSFCRSLDPAAWGGSNTRPFPAYPCTTVCKPWHYCLILPVVSVAVWIVSHGRYWSKGWRYCEIL